MCVHIYLFRFKPFKKSSGIIYSKKKKIMITFQCSHCFVNCICEQKSQLLLVKFLSLSTALSWLGRKEETRFFNTQSTMTIISEWTELTRPTRDTTTAAYVSGPTDPAYHGYMQRGMAWNNRVFQVVVVLLFLLMVLLWPCDFFMIWWFESDKRSSLISSPFWKDKGEEEKKCKLDDRSVVLSLCQ